MQYFRKREHHRWNTYICFIPHLCALFPTGTQVSPLHSCVHQLSYLPLPLLLHPLRLLHPQDALGRGKRRARKQENLCTTGELGTALWAPRCEVTNIIATKCKVACQAQHRLDAWLPCHGSFLKHILSPLFPFHFPLLQIPFTLLLSRNLFSKALTDHLILMIVLSWSQTSLACSLLREGSRTSLFECPCRTLRPNFRPLSHHQQPCHHPGPPQVD